MCEHTMKQASQLLLNKNIGDPMVAKWKLDVYDRQKEKNDIDPSMDHDWFDMAYGFALAHGLSPDKAYDFSLVLRDKGLL